MKLMVALTLFCLFAGTLPACAGLMYSAEPMGARIIDADTKQPLEGAVVVAHWQLERGTVGGSYPAGQLMVMETVTDKDGKFNFPGFGPKPAITSHLVHKDPALILFKSGYHYRVLTNQYTSDIEQRTRMVRRSEWDGKTIEMKPLKGADIQAQYKNLLNFSKEVDEFATWHVNPCQWIKLPMAVSKMMQERKKLEAQGARSVIDRTLDRQLLEGKSYFIKQCGSSAQTFIEGMTK